MRKFILAISLLTFVSISVSFTFSGDSKKSASACPYVQKMESSNCPYLNNKMNKEGSTELQSECPYSKGNSEKSNEFKNEENKRIENIRS